MNVRTLSVSTYANARIMTALADNMTIRECATVARNTCRMHHTVCVDRIRQTSRTTTETRTDMPYGTVTTFNASPVFTLVNNGETDAYHASWMQLDRWAETHALPTEWSISDGTAMQHAIDSDHHTAHIMNGTAWRPAYIADAHIGDTIRYTTQSADFAATPPFVTDSTRTATITDMERVIDVTRPYVAWTDADGVIHRNAPNMHIHIQLTRADI